MNKQRIAIVDYNAGNIKSIQNAFFRLGFEKVGLVKNSTELLHADALVLPGVGAFAHCAKNLKTSGLLPTIEELIFSKSRPILGICVGMQLFFQSSTEDGLHFGLGWIPGVVAKICPPENFNIPHVGWNQVKITKQDGIFDRVQEHSNFYFDHSFAAQCPNEYVSSTTFHGVEIVASVQMNNMYGVQFHPEKSGNNGLRTLRAFTDRI